MSKTRDNALTMNYSGMFGKQMVYRNRDGMSIMAKKPKKSTHTPVESQIATRRRFRAASRWAKVALQDPTTLAMYAARASGMKTPYILAITNYMRPPEVTQINTSEYTGAIGTPINVVAYDDFEIKGVTVKIADSAGSVFEQGPCVENLSDETWVYTATKEISDLHGLVITAVAKDFPNHTGSLSVTL